MKHILKYGIVAGALYLGINWAADHPLYVKAFRKHMNEAVDKTLSTVKETINEGATSVASQTEND